MDPISQFFNNLAKEDKKVQDVYEFSLNVCAVCGAVREEGSSSISKMCAKCSQGALDA